jgi:hypothetical protein
MAHRDDQWREPQDEYGRALQNAFNAVIASPGSLRSLAPLEPILNDLYMQFDQHRAGRLGWMAFELEEALAACELPIAADVARYVESLQELIFWPNPYNADVGDMLIWVRKILASETDG